MTESRKIQTELSVFVESYRTDLGLTQPAFQERLNAHIDGGLTQKKYITKIETGHIKNPKENFFVALATETGKSVEELKSLHELPATGTAGHQATPGGRLVRLAVGHCAWGGPIILAALEGWLPDLDVTSMVAAPKPDERLQAGEATWLSTGSHGEPPILPRAVPRPGNAKVRALSAADIIEWLTDGDIDIAAVPGNVIEERDHLVSIGRVLDTASGTTLLAETKLARALQELGANGAGRAGDRTASITTHQLGSALLALRSSSPKIAAESGTVAETFLASALGCKGNAEGEPSLFDIQVDCSTADLIEVNWAELVARTPGLVGLLTWEPIASWLRPWRAKAPTKYSVQLSPTALGQFRHLTFDVVILKRNRTNRRITRHFARLFEKCWQAAAQLGRLPIDRQSGEAEMLARYFALNSNIPRDTVKNAAEMFRGLRYCVYFNMEHEYEFVRGW